jgi:hypothetical protein
MQDREGILVCIGVYTESIKVKYFHFAAEYRDGARGRCALQAAACRQAIVTDGPEPGARHANNRPPY